MHRVKTTVFSLGTLLLGACANLPTAPGVLALPGTGKNFDAFRVDDANCRTYAYVQIGGRSAEQSATISGVGTAAVGTALGAAAGAAIGGGQGAAAGAGLGLLGGGIAGAGTASNTRLSHQERYDNAYVQCMYAQGHRVPVYGNFTEGATTVPPPPPGNPPAPPPDVLNSTPSK